MLTFDFENVDVPLYEYIYKCIKENITNGSLKANEKLPSKRAFAENNGVSVITVQTAYDQLVSEGYIYAVSKKGYYVSDIVFTETAHEDTDVLVDTRIKLPDEETQNYINLSANHVNPDNFPFSIWARLLRETIAARSDELMKPSPAAGIYELRNAIASHLRSFRGMNIDPAQIVIGAGTEYLYSLIIQLLGRSQVYSLEDPGYKKQARVYEKNGVRCSFAGMDKNGLMISELERIKAQIAHVSPTHHFPTGITMTVSRRYELLGWASKPGRYIIEDDYDSEFRLTGRPVPPLISLDTNEKVIYINTFSKSLSSTIRVSYMVLPPHLVTRFYEQLSFYSCTVSNFEQYTLAAFIGRGYFEKHINRMRHYYIKQREQVKELINIRLKKGSYEIVENDSGLHFLLKLRNPNAGQKVRNALNDNQILLRPLSDYYSLEEDRNNNGHIFLVNYSNLKTEELEKALKIIKNELI